jgi:hypothetical protein
MEIDPGLTFRCRAKRILNNKSSKSNRKRALERGRSRERERERESELGKVKTGQESWLGERLEKLNPTQ